jgi:hypothetical protein
MPFPQSVDDIANDIADHRRRNALRLLAMLGLGAALRPPARLPPGRRALSASWCPLQPEAAPIFSPDRWLK